MGDFQFVKLTMYEKPNPKFQIKSLGGLLGDGPLSGIYFWRETSTETKFTSDTSLISNCYF